MLGTQASSRSADHDRADPGERLVATAIARPARQCDDEAIVRRRAPDTRAGGSDVERSSERADPMTGNILLRSADC